MLVELAGRYTIIFGISMASWKTMRRVIVRRSPVHGKGVFALRRIAGGERLLEYKGEATTWREAVRRHQRHGVDGHTFFFGLSNGYVIDGSCGGNSARWLNHACATNCEAVEDAGRVFIEAVRDIEAGDELFIASTSWRLPDECSTRRPDLCQRDVPEHNAGSTGQRQSGSNQCECGLPSGRAAASVGGPSDPRHRRWAPDRTAVVARSRR